MELVDAVGLSRTGAVVGIALFFIGVALVKELSWVRRADFLGKGLLNFIHLFSIIDGLLKVESFQSVPLQHLLQQIKDTDCQTTLNLRCINLPSPLQLAGSHFLSILKPTIRLGHAFQQTDLQQRHA